ncbi:ATP-binding cassette domain-containing protein [Sinomonas atrocyanea]
MAATGAAAALTLGAAQAAGAPAATAAAVLLLQLALAEPLAAASTAAQQLPALRSALVRVAAEEQAVRDAAEERDDLQDAPDRGPGITLRGVTVGWTGGPDVLAGLDLAARPGDWVVVAGPSGSGKSTLLALLTGFLAPRAGSAAVAGPVAWCPQESHLFDSTVRGNLAVARERDHAPSDAELEAVLARVGLLEHVRSLPGGLDARIGSRGAFLSGGRGSDSRSRGPSSPARRWCSSTSRPRTWTRNRGSPSWRRCTARSRTGPSSWSPTTPPS